jgi:hypothetical protein
MEIDAIKEKRIISQKHEIMAQLYPAKCLPFWILLKGEFIKLIVRNVVSHE